MNSLVVDKRISGLIEVPAGFESGLLSGRLGAKGFETGFSGVRNAVELTFMGDYANEVFTRGYIDSYMQSLGVVVLAAGGDAATLKTLLSGVRENRVPEETLTKDETLLKEEMDKDIYRLMIASIMMFSFYMAINIASLLYTDRTRGTYRRIKAGLVTSPQYVAAVAVIGFVLMVLVNGPSLVLYALSGGDPGVPFAATAGLFAVYSLFVVAFGMFAGLVMPSFGGIIAMIVGVVTITSMLGGAFFPIETAPAVFQAIGHITPQYWVFDAVKAFQTGEGSPLGAAFVMLLMALLFFVLSGIHFASNRGMLRTIDTRDAA
jgi:ABC-2 type transport system permease protein